MALITARDFPGLNPRRDISPITNAIGGLLNQNRQQQEVQRLEKIQSDKQVLKTTGAQFLGLRNINNLDTQKTEMSKLARAALQRGEDITIFEEGLKIQDPDEMNLFLTRIATRATDADKILERELGLSKKLTTRAFAPVTLVNPDTKEKLLVTPTFNPNTNQAELKPLDFPEGFEISTETPEEKRAADVVSTGEETRAEITAKEIAKRRQSQITTGLDAADATANVRRALDLLGEVETGGVDAVSLKVKQVFGVEGADEAELSSRLGKAVLSQLRATFGAAFTEREGARLASIEAGFGKSSAGNKRLLQQALRILERSANRGATAADAEGDVDSAQDIRDALVFELSSGIDNQPAQQTDQPVVPEVLRFDEQGNQI